MIFWDRIHDNGYLIIVEVISMAKKTQAGTNVGKVKQQNAGGQFGTEFASETDVQEVKRQNQQSQSKAPR